MKSFLFPFLKLGQYGIFLSYSSPDVYLVTFFLSVDSHRAVGVGFLQLFDELSPVLKRGQYCLGLH